MTREKSGTKIFTSAPLFSRFNMTSVSPASIKQIAVFAFILTQRGEILLITEISPIQPINTMTPTDITIMLKRRDSFFSLAVSFGRLSFSILALLLVQQR